MMSNFGEMGKSKAHAWSPNNLHLSTGTKVQHCVAANAWC